MANRSIAQQSDEFYHLVGWLQLRKDGEMLSYDFIEKETGIEMDTKGRALLRKAVLGARRSVTSIPRQGYELATAGNSHQHMKQVLLGIDRALQRGMTKQEILTERFSEQWTPQQREFFSVTASVLNAQKLAVASTVHRLEKAKDIPLLAGSHSQVLMPKNGKEK